MATMVYARVRDLVIAVHGTENPTDDEWTSYLRFLRGAQRGEVPLIGILVTTLGGTPNPAQRKAILSAKGRAATCVCTDSWIARCVLTAMSWIHSHPMHAFPLNDIDGALETLGLSEERRADVRATVERLQAQLAGERLAS